MEDVQFQRGMDYYQDIQEQYRKALNNLQRDIEIWYGRLAVNNEISLSGAKKLLKEDELDEFHWTVEQYIKAGEENALDERWMKELENASAKYHISRLEAMKLQMRQHAELLSTEFEGGVTEFLHKSYGEQYYRTAFEIAKGTGVGSNLVKLDDRRVDIVLKKPWARDGKNFSDRIWTNKEKLVNELHTELTQSIIRGEAPRKAIDRLAKTMNVSKSQAGNLIMTETAAISSIAQKDCFKDLGVEEFEVVETLDGHTCEICQEMDGKHFPMSYFQIGETAPPFHPRCRGCTCPYFDDEFTIGEERAARDPETGKTVYVPANLTYPEWKREFVQNWEQITLDELAHDKGTNYNMNRSTEELKKAAEKLKNDCAQYSGNGSKWSGKINIDNSLSLDGVMGQKEWNCDITLVETADDGVVLHEMLHSCSVSHYDSMTYLENQAIEEASVEFLKQQICQKKGIISEDGYHELVMILQVVNEQFRYGTDLEFASELFNIPLPDRYTWLETKVSDSLKDLGASFSDFNEVMFFLERLKGAI